MLHYKSIDQQQSLFFQKCNFLLNLSNNSLSDLVMYSMFFLFSLLKEAAYNDVNLSIEIDPQDIIFENLYI